MVSKKETSLTLASVSSLKPSIGLPIICESVSFQPRRGAMAENELYHDVEFGVTNEGKIETLVKELSRALGTKIDVPNKWSESSLFSMRSEDWRAWGKIIFIRNPKNPKTGFLKFETTVCSSHEDVAQRMREGLERFRTMRGVEEHRTRDGQGIKLRRGHGKGFDNASVLWMRSILRKRRQKPTGRTLKALKREPKKLPPKRAK